ncbi:ammonia-forming cytochrome c nitrite reductase subunit c552 [Aliikangiella sp. IMCC44359]|uniref:ammonia-forming cytochrome c nitrite reductase subunit c552 n=1 Tax=Aliikangiella sp. IMCC44359 TaxID=3459125 RepID=UPI00403AB434
MTNNNNKKAIGILPIGLGLTVIIGAILGFNLLKGDKSFFLSGDTTHGHYQMELKCNACHSSAFSGPDAMQEACESCHADELDKVNDSHPKSVFADPRNAELLSQLDARFCVTCHREHKPEITRSYGVTLAEDFCFHCHQDVGENRPSHKDFKYDTCASSGCHNFHDNSMLYEKFISKHIDEPINKKKQLNPKRTGLKRWLKKNKLKKLPDAMEADITNFYDGGKLINKEITEQASASWHNSVHSKVNANCSSCHAKSEKPHGGLVKIESIEKQCASCHKKQQESFFQGKHGMRLSLDLSRMTTSDARLKMTSSDTKLLSCVSCHNPHELDIKKAAVESCLGCHQDEHSINYKRSKHFELWEKELLGEVKVNSGVSCATCHLPRIKKGRRVTVEHNQNLNLRPNTKMLRKVCMNCHGMEFSVSSLSNKELIKNNFNKAPKVGHQSFELVKKRIKQKKKSKQN